MTIYFVLVSLLILIISRYFKSKSRFNFKEKKCFITGGSSGLGKALAIELASRGALVTIVARSKPPLEETVLILDKITKANQFFQVDVLDYESIKEAVDSVEPDLVFCCAGASYPGLFLDQSPTDFKLGMDLNYMGTVNTCHAAAKNMIKLNKKGKIIMTSSTMGVISFTGYSQYAPTKHAIRSLADTLRQEIQSLSFHLYLVGTINSPGLAKENLSKPIVTFEIEGGGSGLEPRQAALKLIQGIEQERFIICSDWITELFRISCNGISYRNNIFLDLVCFPVSFLLSICFPIYSDFLTRKYFQKGNRSRNK